MLSTRAMIATVTSSIAAITSVLGFITAPAAVASPLWRGDGELIKNDGDKGGISTGLRAWRYHDEGNFGQVWFRSEGEHLTAHNWVRDSSVTVCAIVSVYTIEGKYLDGNSACRTGFGTHAVNWSFDEGYPTRVTIQVLEPGTSHVLYAKTQTGGRT